MMPKRQARFAFNPNPSLVEQYDIFATAARHLILLQLNEKFATEPIGEDWCWFFH